MNKSSLNLNKKLQGRKDQSSRAQIYNQLTSPIKNASAEQIAQYNENFLTHLPDLSDAEILKIIANNDYINMFGNKKRNYKSIEELLVSLLESDEKLINSRDFWHLVLRKESFFNMFTKLAAGSERFNIIDFVEHYTSTFAQAKPQSAVIRSLYYTFKKEENKQVIYPHTIQARVNIFFLDNSDKILEHIKKQKTIFKLQKTNFIEKVALREESILNYPIQYQKKGHEVNVAQFYFIKTQNIDFYDKYKSYINQNVLVFDRCREIEKTFYEFLSEENPSLLLNLKAETHFEYLLAPTAMYLLEISEARKTMRIFSALPEPEVSIEKLISTVDKHATIAYLEKCLKYYKDSEDETYLYKGNLAADKQVEWIDKLIEKKKLEQIILEQKQKKALKL